MWNGGLLEKLRAEGIQGDLLQLPDHYQQRILRVVVNGQAAEAPPARTPVSVTGLGAGVWPVESVLRRPPPAAASSLSLC